MHIRQRRSKYDLIYALPIGGTYEVPMTAKEAVPDPTIDPRLRAARRAASVNKMVPTTFNNLRTTLFKHSQITGQKFHIQPRPDRGVFIVTRMPDGWSAPRQRGEGEAVSESTKRVQEWQRRKDQDLADAWAAFPHRAEVPLSKAQVALLAKANMYTRDLAGQASEAIRRGAHEFLLKRPMLRHIHPDPDTAAQYVVRAANRDGHNLTVLDDIRSVAGRNLQVKVLRDVEAEKRREAIEAAAAEAMEKTVEAMDALNPPAGVPRDRRDKHYDYNYLWWQDFAWTRPDLHPLQPGQRAKVCFLHPTQYSNDKPRKEDIERWLETYQRKWQKKCDAHPDWGLEHAPEYRLVGKFDSSGIDSHLADIRGIERIKRDPDTGAIQELIHDWDIDDPFALPVPAGQFALARCGRWRGQEWVPADNRDLVDIMRMLKDHGVNFGVYTQYGHGKGVFLLDRKPDDVDLEAVRPEPTEASPASSTEVDDLLAGLLD